MDFSILASIKFFPEPAPHAVLKNWDNQMFFFITD
jgi:hypothetical protein